MHSLVHRVGFVFTQYWCIAANSRQLLTDDYCDQFKMYHSMPHNVQTPVVTKYNTTIHIQLMTYSIITVTTIFRLGRYQTNTWLAFTKVCTIFCKAHITKIYANYFNKICHQQLSSVYLLKCNSTANQTAALTRWEKQPHLRMEQLKCTCEWTQFLWDTIYCSLDCTRTPTETAQVHWNTAHESVCRTIYECQTEQHSLRWWAALWHIANYCKKKTKLSASRL